MAELWVYLKPLYQPSTIDDWLVGWQSLIEVVTRHPLWEDGRHWKSAGEFIDG